MKRSEKFTFVNQAKKAKLQEQDDDVWGEDPEVDAFDKCLDLASQLCSQDLPLTSYDTFKPKSDVYTSTQAFLRPSTSYFKLPKENILNSSTSTVNTIIKKDVTSHELQQDLMCKIQQLEQQNKKLKEGYESKDGEISILRSTLKTAQKSVDLEKMQKLKLVEENQQKWNIKFNSATKDLSQIKCELNLKNLEITNLKDKLAQCKKIVNSSLNMSMFTEEMNLSQLNFKRPAVPNSSKCSKQIQTSPEHEINPRKSGIYYPLHNLIPNTIFEKCAQENSTIQLKSIAESSCSAFRHNFSMTQCDSVIFLNPVSTANFAFASVTSLYPEISKLLKLGEEELNSDIATTSVRKIVSLTRELLLCLLQKLQQIEEAVSFDDIEAMNHLYLEQTQSVYSSDCIFGGTSWCENEAAIDLRRCLSIVATLSLNCNTVSNYLTDDLNNDFHLFNEATPVVKHEFLTILLQITTIIEKIRRGHQFSGLLVSIIQLLNNLAQAPKLPLQSYDFIVNIFRQIIFARPTKPVFKHICAFLPTISKHYKFVTQLCKLSNAELIQKKDGIIYFTNEICTFRILATELIECNVDVNMACNVTQFLRNTVTCNVPWMYHQDGPRCECLVQVYSLAIEILYNSLEEFTSRNLYIIDKTMLQTYYTMFRDGLIVLNILTVRIPDLVIRCSRLYSQYQTIIKNINAIKDDLNFETAHETVLDNLICQLNSEVQKVAKSDSLNSNVVVLFNKSFTTSF